MRKLAPYLKPFLGGLLLVIALLFGQAVCDLNLPNYMSNIVNVGIQQSGIEHAAPEAISTQGMALMQVFMSEAERAVVDQHYAPVSLSDPSPKGKTMADTYPKAQEGALLAQKSVTPAERASLDQAFGSAAATLGMLGQEMAERTGAGTSEAGTQGQIDVARLYQMQPMLNMLPGERIQSAREKATGGDAMMLSQYGIAFAKIFYEELGADVAGMQTQYILRVGAQMLLIALLGGIATVLVSLLSSRIAAGVARNLRAAVFSKVSTFSNAEFDRFSTASLITRTTNDVTQVQMLLTMGIRMICYAPIMAVGGIIMALNKASSLAWIIGGAVALLLGLVIVVFTVALPKFKLMQKLVDRLNLVAREHLTGLMVIRAFRAEQHEEKRFDGANTDLAKTQLFTSRVMVTMMPFMTLILSGMSLLTVWVGSHQIAQSNMQVGDMMAFMQYATQVIFSFLMISMMFIFVPRAAVSATRIAEVLESKPMVLDPEQPKAFDPAQKGTVVFDHVNFRYENAEEDALHDISFVAPPGQTTAFIGSTGSGKSTIASLLLRFYDVTGGSIRVDGRDLREVTQADLRQRIGYVPQRAELLSGTIASNLRYGAPKASDEDMAAAATVAQAITFIQEKPEGFDSDIAQGGANVSGGQKQRLSIARALAKGPEIFLFDDSFSALDFKTDVTLRKALKAHTGESTVILVAQRVSTIMSAEQIIVLDKGRIVGQGTHQELLKTCEPYMEIAASQLSKEELA